MHMRTLRLGALFVAVTALGQAGEIGPSQKVTIERVPDGGIQPQVAVDTKGVVHMLYYKGDPGHGDIFYVRSRDGGVTRSPPAIFAARASPSGKTGACTWPGTDRTPPAPLARRDTSPCSTRG
jgi:hypothetical protein